MAIILRQNTATNTGKGTKLTFAEMDSNLESFFYSSSLSGNVLTLFTTGSVSHSIDLNSVAGSINTGSLLLTASYSGQVITFTKADNSTFTLNLGDVVVELESGSLLYTGSYNSSTNVLTLTKGNGTSFDINLTSNSDAKIAVTNTSTDQNYYLTFVEGTSGEQDLRVDNSAIVYNPSSNTLQTANLVLTGDLTVQGTKTELQVSELRVEDKLITVASGSINSAAADGAGIEVAGANQSITWDHANSRFKTSTNLHVSGGLSIGATTTDNALSTFLVLDGSGNVKTRTTGAQGAQGAAGNNGTNGSQGAQGAAGNNGNNGAQGAQGAAGNNGTNGSQGAQGAAGNNGTNGAQGAEGAQGAQGAAGNNGNNGAQGAQGAAGNNGTNGSQGAQGAAGNNGAQGSPGNNGAQGAQGAAGNNGTNGAQGAQGAAGNNGAQGAPGNNGNNGAQGAQGAAGNNGTNGSQGAQGAAGNNGADGAQGAQGAAGNNGAQGSPGNNGAQGAQGAASNVAGPQGAQGAEGAQGAPGNVAAQGAQGAQGAAGNNGNNGAQGAQGAAGNNGNNGAQGAPGNDGAQGAQGAQGAAGNNGNNGAQGAEGAQGAQGAQGAASNVAGAQGAQGAAGNNGAQGAQGAEGAQGTSGALANTIYNADDYLTDNRTVNHSNYSLTFLAGAGADWIIDGDGVDANIYMKFLPEPNEPLTRILSYDGTTGQLYQQSVASSGAQGAQGAQGPTGAQGSPGSGGGITITSPADNRVLSCIDGAGSSALAEANLTFTPSSGFGTQNWLDVNSGGVSYGQGRVYEGYFDVDCAYFTTTTALTIGRDTYNAIFIDYTYYDPADLTPMRTSNFVSHWNSSTITYTNHGTIDIGTIAVDTNNWNILRSSISGTNVIVTVFNSLTSGGMRLRGRYRLFTKYVAS